MTKAHSTNVFLMGSLKPWLYEVRDLHLSPCTLHRSGRASGRMLWFAIPSPHFSSNYLCSVNCEVRNVKVLILLQLLFCFVLKMVTRLKKKL